MKRNKNIFIAMVLVLALIMCTSAFSEESTASAKLTMDDFIQTASLWDNAIDNDEYQFYIEKIIYMTTTEVEQKYYPYILSEMFFYRYFAPISSSMPVFSELDKKADELIETFLAFEKNSPETYIAHKLFEVIGEFYGNRDSLPSAENQVYKKTAVLPDAATERKKLLNAIGDAEAMYARFSKLLASQTGNVELRFSGEAYTKTKNNPALVYVIENEPTFALLKDAFEKSDTMPDIAALNDYATLYYAFVDEIKASKELFAKWGVPVNSVLPEDLSTLLMIYDADPFLLTCLESSVMEKTEKIVSYLSSCSDLYINRINKLANTTGK